MTGGGDDNVVGWSLYSLANPKKSTPLTGYWIVFVRKPGCLRGLRHPFDSSNLGRKAKTREGISALIVRCNCRRNL